MTSRWYGPTRAPLDADPLGHVPVQRAYADHGAATSTQLHGEPVPDRREAAVPVDDEPGHGFVVVLLGQLDAGGLGHLVQAAPGVHQPALAVRDGHLGDGVRLVGDVTHQFLSDVLVGDDAGHASVLVQDDGEFFSELARAFRDQVTGRSVLRKPVWGRRTVANGAGVSFLPVLGHQDETRAAYDGVVDLYASMFANGLETHPFARNMIGTFAELVRGTGNLRVADVGCGPGHVTAMLHDLGLDAFGLDLSPAMVAHARRAHPALRFDEARMEALPVEDGALGGVLAHYSMIHTPPGELPALLAEQVRVLAPGGLLLVSFFGTEGPEPVRFDHKVTPAYSWPADRFAELLAEAGLVTFARLLHDPASERGFLDTHLLARRL